MLLATVVSAVLAATPEDWLQVPEPSKELVRCANHHVDRAWRVSTRASGVHIEPEPTPEHDTGGPLPFALPKELPARGLRHVLAVPDGFLVGFDAGEWGGALFWLSSTGQKWRKLSGENVNGLVALGSREVLVLQGLNHLDLEEGMARWFQQGADARWTLSAKKKLDAGPQTFTATRDAVYVVTARSLTRIGRDRKVTVLQKLPTALLYPSSMMADADGALWMGMRYFVLRLTPGPTGFSREWFVPKDCPRVEFRNHECECVK
jgi:hypothetical protein